LLLLFAADFIRAVSQHTFHSLFLITKMTQQDPRNLSGFVNPLFSLGEKIKGQKLMKKLVGLKKKTLLTWVF
jgi:hypothetical protein